MAQRPIRLVRRIQAGVVVVGLALIALNAGVWIVLALRRSDGAAACCDLLEAVALIVLSSALLGAATWRLGRLLARRIDDDLRRLDVFLGAAATGAASIDPAGFHHDEFARLAESGNRMVATRIQATAQAAEAEQRYREVFEASRDAILVHGPEDGRLIDANRAACELFGCSRDELLTAELGRFSAPDAEHGHEAVRDRLRRAAAGEDQHFAWRSRRADGTLFWSEVDLHRATIGGRVCLVSVVRDVSVRIRATQSSVSSNAE